MYEQTNCFEDDSSNRFIRCNDDLSQSVARDVSFMRGYLWKGNHGDSFLRRIDDHNSFVLYIKHLIACLPTTALSSNSLLIGERMPIHWYINCIHSLKTISFQLCLSLRISIHPSRLGVYYPDLTNIVPIPSSQGSPHEPENPELHSPILTICGRQRAMIYGSYNTTLPYAQGLEYSIELLSQLKKRLLPYW